MSIQSSYYFEWRTFRPGEIGRALRGTFDAIVSDTARVSIEISERLQDGSRQHRTSLSWDVLDSICDVGVSRIAVHCSSPEDLWNPAIDTTSTDRDPMYLYVTIEKKSDVLIKYEAIHLHGVATRAVLLSEFVERLQSALALAPTPDVLTASETWRREDLKRFDEAGASMLTRLNKALMGLSAASGASDSGARAAVQSMSGSPEKKSLRDRFESHPVIFGIGLFITGYLAGLGTFVWLDDFVKSRTATGALQSTATCRIEGLDRLDHGHRASLDALQKQLIELERMATAPYQLSVNLEKYAASASRVRQDIAAENLAYQTAVQQLSKKCE